MGIRHKDDISNHPKATFHGWDTETHKIRQGLLMPPMVCLSTHHDGQDGLYNKEDGVARLEALLRDPFSVLIAHNAPYDIGVALAAGVSPPLVFGALDAGRIKCTKVREQILAIAYDRLRFDARRNKMSPGFSLAYLVDIYFGVDISGGKTPRGCICQTTTLAKGTGPCEQCGTWRLCYNTLDETPVEEWPEAARSYAIDDALWAEKVFFKQVEVPDPQIIDGNHINDENYQLRAAVCFHLMAAWGVVVDANAIGRWEMALEDNIRAIDAAANRLGVLRKNGTRDMKVLRAVIEAAYGERPVPLTEKGSVSTSRDTLLGSGDEWLIAMADPTGAKKNKTTYLPILHKGASGIPITSSPNVLVATGRSSWRGPNWQNPPRGGGFRGCIIPRIGFVFVSCDYSAIEMVCMAQILLWMFGRSAMADAINAGRDLHSVMAARMMQLTYDAFRELLLSGDKKAKENRQGAKIANFGFMGGMAAGTLVDYAKGFGMDLSAAFAEHLRTMWLETWTQMGPYLEDLGQRARWGNFPVEQFVSLRVRGGCSYTSGANTAFQGLAADGAKEAGWQLTKACYNDRGSVLFGCRPVMFIHDEYIVEVPEERTHECAWEISRIMEEAMKTYTPDVRVVAEPAAMVRWEKGAELVVDAQGRLIPWLPDVKYTRDSKGRLTP